MEIPHSADIFQHIIPPKPTTYGGIKFRSRLEATWAAFFDLYGVGWQYEPPLGDRIWTPDFRLYDLTELENPGVLAEVRPYYQFSQWTTSFRTETQPKLKKISSEIKALYDSGINFWGFIYLLGGIVDSPATRMVQINQTGEVVGEPTIPSFLSSESAIQQSREIWTQASNITRWKPKE